MPAELKSRIPEVIAELDVRIHEAAGRVADHIATDAASRVAYDEEVTEPHLRDNISAVEGEDGVWMVKAGGNGVYWGGWVELGTVNMAARPFLVPAAEAAVPIAEAEGMAALRGL